ncbi:IucA/IucC family protein [Streptomyces lydicamycinicus]|uniref:IucA/IucC family protein n=1 Tax=Streptomyces lydicamycinicus TaxID=1546107 RepID=A0A0P4REH0_9ACTN|nr:IucA/IucC family protein [Streptomyces lydicamycinicus]GAO11661.1 IucA/IucC family protein [Streptomyces lydicamycinicus]
MNERPGPDGGQPAERIPAHQGAGIIESVPRQQRRAPDEACHQQPHERPDQPVPHGAAASHDRARGDHDPLDHPDPAVAADAAGIEHLLRCWLRESGTHHPAEGRLRLPLRAAAASALIIPVRYWSPTGWHRLGAPILEGAPPGAAPLDAVTLAAMLRREAAHGDRRASDGGEHRVADGGERPEPDATPQQAPDGDGTELVGRVANSVRNVAAFLTDRRARPADDHGALFLEAEQSLLLGHPLHPTPKSREGLSDAETRAYSPELRGAFPLRWMAVHRSVLAADSAWTVRGKPVPADRLTRELAGSGCQLPDDTVPLPLHPWQARELADRSDVTALREAGLLHDLGTHGPLWHPTSSVRTVYRPDADAMLKLSLGLRITNSRRENLRKELARGVEVHRLLRTGLAKQWQTVHPGFDIVRDPAYLAVDGFDGEPVQGLDVVIRHNPFSTTDDAVCIAGLTCPRPWPGRSGVRSRLEDLVGTLGARTGRPLGAVATEWFLRYLEAVVRPVLWLDGTAGIVLEAHQQNTVVLLDPDGWPVGGRYRDNQGYYFRTSRRAELERRLPGIGAASDSFVADDVTDERFAYYLGINNVLGLIGAFGSQRLVREEILLAAFRRFLADAAAAPRAHRSPLPEQLLAARTLRCKANLATRLHGLDELVGPVETQSVYVTLPNPLAP